MTWEFSVNSWAGQKQKWQKSESESEDYLSSDSDLESELDISAKDDSRRKKKAPPPALKRALVVMDALALSLEARIVFALPHIVLIEMAAIFNGNPTTLMRAMDVSAAFAVTSVGRI